MRAYEELPWQFARCEEWEDLLDLLQGRDFVEWADEHCPWNLRHWWSELNSRGYRAADAYRRQLDQLDKCETSYLEIIARILRQTGDSDESLRVREAAEARYEGGRRLGLSLMARAGILMDRKRFDDAADLLRKAEQAFLEDDDQVRAACARADLATTHFRSGRYDQASELYFNAVRALQKAGATALLGTVYEGLGASLTHQGNAVDALAYLKRAEYAFRSTGRRRDLAGTLANLGVGHAFRGEVDEALEYFDESSRLFRELNDAEEADRVDGMRESVAKTRPEVEAIRRRLLGDAELP
jgi:tetratricopeptide (TPR) repeat protein